MCLHCADSPLLIRILIDICAGVRVDGIDDCTRVSRLTLRGNQGSVVCARFVIKCVPFSLHRSEPAIGKWVNVICKKNKSFVAERVEVVDATETESDGHGHKMVHQSCHLSLT